MKYFCCDAAPPRGHQAHRAAPTPSSSSRCATTSSPVRACASARCSCACCDPGFALTPDNVLIDGGERLPVVPVEWVAAADNLPAGTDPALVDGIDDLPRTLVVRTTVFGDFSTLHAASSREFGQRPTRQAASIRSCRTSNSRSRSNARRTSTARSQHAVSAATCRRKPDIDYLAKDYTGFRRLMLDRLNLLAPGWTRAIGRRRGRHAGRSCWPMPPTTSRTGRTPSPTRPISPPHTSACRCAAMRGWWTMRCTTAATRAPSSASPYRSTCRWRREPSY